MIDEKIEKPLLDLGLVKGYSDTLKQYYRLPSMDFHLIWVYYEDGRCSVPNDLYVIEGSIVTSVRTRNFNTVSDAIPFLKSLIKKHKELLVKLKRRELEQDFIKDEVKEEKDFSDKPLPVHKSFAKNLLGFF